MRVNMTFSKVTYTATRYIMKDGKKRRQQHTFWQTINPYNVKADGTVKTRADIILELKGVAKRWQEEPDVAVR